MAIALGDSGFVDVLDWWLEYRMVGPRPGEAPTIVLLHEGLGSVSTWKDFPDAVSAATGCGVFAYSRRGYGKSSPFAYPWALDYMQREAKEIVPVLLDRIGFEDGVLLGHSDGASISAIYAGQSRDPRLKGVILIAPHFFTEDEGLAYIAMAADAYKSGDLKRRLEPHHGANVDNAFWGWNLAWLDPGFKSWNIEEHLPNIAVPVLGMQGINDQYGTAKQMDAITRQCKTRTEIRWLENCTHFPHREQPEATVAATAEFVKSLY